MSEDKKSPHAHYKTVADELIALQILGLIGAGKKISQRKITDQTGLAAGLVHSYMRKVISKGWVKARQVSRRRWLYYLTPEGFLEKSSLTLKYFRVTLQNYREAQSLLRKHLDRCHENDWTRLVVTGCNDLSEIAALNIKSMDRLELVAVIADGGGETVAGQAARPFSDLAELDYDKILICDIKFLEWWSEQGHEADSNKLIHLDSPISAAP